MHEFRLRVYYEDVDLAGIVYYANYLRFIERGRTEALIAAGVDQARLKAETGIVFAVRRVEVDYLHPARFQDELTVTTALAGMGGARVELMQEVRRDGAALVRARVVIVALDAAGRPARMPGEMRAAMAGLGRRAAEGG
ncbi:tol-pal system-associated acyl-CoA thioesterase [Amaricoccus sp.]|uniref:tol-pal system-associated acyl-CoA thioesterase n=1 Tax=Amaricoccus sp. TaxID=1872485 RepID=UPI001B462A4A|nr:tol-pal system-associated acyl-CoA thioesterase [Amaricoccus sp.]MBP7003364.1 tol-pal system-associated acyl-CoA thioesterase [Amaricoccus sp.]